MTRSAKKEQERLILKAHLKHLGLEPYEILEERERPDFLVQAPIGIVGVEVTEFHTLPHIAGEAPRKVVEATFDQLRERVVGYRESHRELDDLSVTLWFTRLWLPSTKELDPFISGVRDVIVDSMDQLSEKHLRIKIGEGHPQLIRKYLSSIRVRRCGCYLEWDWNHSFGGVGATESEIFTTIGPKLLLPRLAGLDENHLVVTSGHTIGSTMAIRSAKQLEEFLSLNTAIDAGPYDQVTLLDFGVYARKRLQPWRALVER